ncbi:prothymosin alpha-A-like isoform X1 [Oncorhynchus masou masou]|uniref:prothymosin alpha-A-like isoform X1 n=1 Tax=Oncorhynchus masou masou TaxID=90313 RepID=UPI0031838625
MWTLVAPITIGITSVRRIGPKTMVYQLRHKGPYAAQTIPGDDKTKPDLKEKKLVEEAENGKETPANGKAEAEENGDQDNDLEEDDDDVGEEEDEEDDAEVDEEDEDDEVEGRAGKRVAEDDDDDEDDVGTKKQKTADD